MAERSWLKALIGGGLLVFSMAAHTQNLSGSRTLPASVPFQVKSSGAQSHAPVPPDLPDRLARRAGAVLVRVSAISARAALQQAAWESLLDAAHTGDAAINRASTVTLTAAELEALPLAGRAWEQVALDVPGTAPNSSGDEGATIAGRSFPAELTVDGLSMRLAFGARTSGRSQGRSASLIGPGSGDAALREVQVASGNAEETAGRTLGSYARLETAHGGNALHGQAFLLEHQRLWSAQNPLTQWTRETESATAATVPVFTSQPITPQDHEMLWGVSTGGRVRRSGVYWFTSLDGHWRNHPGVSTVKHPDNFFAQPSNDQMQVLAARLRLSSADPVSEGLAAYSGLLETLAGLLGPASRTESRWTGFGRLDWSMKQAGRFTVEGTGATRDAPGGGLGRAAEFYGTHSYGSSHTQEQWLMARWEKLVTPRLLAVTQGSFARHKLTQPPSEPSAYEQTLNVNAWGRLPQMVVDSSYGFTIGNPARFGPGSYPDEQIGKAQEQLAWMRGRLVAKAGLELSHNGDTTNFVRNETGTYSYSNVVNFASDALAFAAYGITGQLDPLAQHNCDETGKTWRDATGALHGLGYLPCYSHYTQTIGPTHWWLRTNDWAGYGTVQWRTEKDLTLSLALRWELEQAPPPLVSVDNPDLPLTEHLPSFGSEWGPRAGLAWALGKRYAPVVRLAYGLYFGRTPNATLETAMTQTGSLNGDLKFFMRPTDNLNAGSAPPFPYVLAGKPGTLVKPEAVEFAPGFRNARIHQVVASVEEMLPGHVRVEAAGAVSLGRQLPVTLDTNIDPEIYGKTITYAVVDGNGTGPIKSSQITVPFYASWPTSDGSGPLCKNALAGRCDRNYQQINEVFSQVNSTYESAMLHLTRSGRGGLVFHARYTYAHAMDWNPDDSVTLTGPNVLDPQNQNLSEEYGTSDLDVRHAATATVVWQPRWRLPERSARLVNGWRLSGVGTYRSGLPYTMRTSSAVVKEFSGSTAIVGLGAGMNGYGGDNRVYGVGRNTFRYPGTWKADVRLARRFALGETRELELLAESFNLFNHQNVTELETVGYTIDSGTKEDGLPSLHYLTGLKSGQTEFGRSLNANATDYYRPRQVEFGVKMRF